MNLQLKDLFKKIFLLFIVVNFCALEVEAKKKPEESPKRKDKKNHEVKLVEVNPDGSAKDSNPKSDLIVNPTNPSSFTEPSSLSEDVLQETENPPENETFVEIIADELRYNETQDFYEAVGEAIATFPEKNIIVTADQMNFDGLKKLLIAEGNVKVTQNDTTAFGEYVVFHTDTKTYSMEEPKIFSPGIRLKARSSTSEFEERKKPDEKDKVTVNFKDGFIALDKPVGVYFSGNHEWTRYTRERKLYYQNRELRWKDIPPLQSDIKYSAKRITYDQNKRMNNLKIQGARLWLNDKLSIPSPIELTTSVGEAANTRFRGPVLGQQERIGGFAVGPRFFKSYKNSTFALAPIVQIGNDGGFGAGSIVSYNTPGDTTAIMAGYGSLYNRFILNAHQELPYNFEANALVNQFNRNLLFGSSQVGQNYEIAHKFRLKTEWFDRRGIQFRTIMGYAADNLDLFTARNKELLFQARRERGDNSTDEHSGFRFEENISFYTKPLYRVGNEAYNLTLRFREAGSFAFYGTGDSYLVNRIGPAIEATFDRLSFEVDYLYALISGESPFVFDQFIDGSSAIVFDGDLAINKWLSVGTFVNFNIDDSEITRNQIRAEVGPPDFKFRASYDTVRNQVGFGVNMIFGEPIRYEQLKVNL